MAKPDEERAPGTGNKLLQAKLRATDIGRRAYASNGQPDDSQQVMFCSQYDNGVALPEKCFPNLRFTTADDDDIPNNQKIVSITQTCQFVGNENTKLRVLDTPGFHPSPLQSDEMPHLSMDREANLQIFRWIVRAQLDTNNNMHIKRLLYFYPDRGVSQKADGVLQGELSIMFKFFGPTVFGHMVVIATQNLEYQSFTFKKEHCDKIQEIFSAGVKAVTRGELSECCAPVLYIGIDDDPGDILKKIQEAPVYSKSLNFVPEFQKDVCSRCSGQIRYCKLSSGDVDIPVGISRGDDNVLEKYEESKCHPRFIPKYSKAEKVAGGVGHMVKLGLVYAVTTVCHKDSWPCFFLTLTR